MYWQNVASYLANARLYAWRRVISFSRNFANADKRANDDDYI